MKFFNLIFIIMLALNFNACGGGDSGGDSNGDSSSSSKTQTAILTSQISSVTVVKDQVENVTVDAKAIDGSTDTITAQSSNTAVFDVKVFVSTIAITANSVGSGTLTVTSASGKSLTIFVEVISPSSTTIISSIPQNVSASDGMYSDKVVVTWDAVAGATGYVIYIDDANGGDTWDNASTNTYTSTDVTTSFLYTYYVKAIVDGSFSDASQTDDGYVSGYVGAGDEVSTTITHNGVSYAEVISPATKRVWLDRNLGAAEVCTAYDDENCRGDYYQWGRLTDGHEKVNSTLGAFDFSYDTDINNAGNEFIWSNYDWTTTDDDGSLRSANWNKTDGSSVCPIGFKVPSIAELEAEKADISFLKAPSASSRTANYGVDQYFLGYNNSHLWSSTPTVGDISTGTQYGKILITVDDVNGETYNGNRLDGYQVRCIKSDESDVGAPVELNSFSLTYGSFMIQTPDSTKIAIVDRDDGAKIYNRLDLISSFVQPLSTYDLGDYLFGAAISSDNSKMYLVGYDEGMDIVNISDSTNPTKIGTTFNDDINYYLGVTLSPNENIAYISNRDNGILIVDVSGDTPTKLAAYNTDGAAFYSVVSSDGNTLYVADESNGIVILDVSDSANPTLINSLDTDGKAYKMTLSSDNSKVYLADNVGGLKIVDVSNVTISNAPTVLGTILPENTTSVNNVTLNNAGTMAFLACSDGGATGDNNADGLYVIDITDSTSPTLKTSQVTLNGGGSSVILSQDENTVYLLSGKGFNTYSMKGLLAR